MVSNCILLYYFSSVVFWWHMRFQTASEETLLCWDRVCAWHMAGNISKDIFTLFAVLMDVQLTPVNYSLHRMSNISLSLSLSLPLPSLFPLDSAHSIPSFNSQYLHFCFLSFHLLCGICLKMGIMVAQTTRTISRVITPFWVGEERSTCNHTGYMTTEILQGPGAIIMLRCSYWHLCDWRQNDE